MNTEIFENRSVDMDVDTEFVENRGVELEMDTAWNRCPSNSTYKVIWGSTCKLLLIESYRFWKTEINRHLILKQNEYETN